MWTFYTLSFKNLFFKTDSRCNARGIFLVIDMKEGTIKYQFPLKKGMEHFPRKRNKLIFWLYP
jgi:hypothetical protein